MSARVYLIALLALAACRADVRKEAITDSTGVNVSALRDQIVESSAPASPAWIENEAHQSPNEIAFIGRAEAPALDAAKALALRDLYSAISSFVAIDVESSHDDRQTLTEQNITETLRTHTSAALREINPDQHYWERAVTSPLTPGDSRFRYWVRAWVPRAELARARIQRQAEREKQTNKKSIAVLPFSRVEGASDDPTTAAIAGGMAEDLTKLLSRRPGIHATDPAMVRAVLPAKGGSTELERVERVQDALLPDFVITGAFRREGDRVKVTAVAYDAREGRALRSRALEKPFREVQGLEQQLAEGLAADLGAAAAASRAAQPQPPPQSPPSPPKQDAGPEAFEAYHDAYRHYQAGANDKALERIRRSIELRPTDPASFMRLGRILERMGRYARLPPTNEVLQQRALDIRLCTEQARRQAQRAEDYLRERALKLQGPQQPAAKGTPWWTDDTLIVDMLLDAAAQVPLATDGTELTLGRKVELIQTAMLAYAPGYYSPGAPTLPEHFQAAVLDRTSDLRWILIHAMNLSGWVPFHVLRALPGYAEWAPEYQSKRRGARAQSAAEAYFEARFLAEEIGDFGAAMQAQLALADLSARVDRLDHAYSLYLTIEERAILQRDEHHVSLARAGQANVLRQFGDLHQAKTKLLQALSSRLLLGEKPYLLELYNSLGGLAVEMGKYEEAASWYRRAQRIAAELGNDYLKAVLSNNVGVLEHHRGLESEAVDHLEDALERLTGFGEADGRIASGLNVALLRHLRGDPATAMTAIDDVAKLVGETAQEGRLAELAAKRGSIAASRGEIEEAEYQLALAYLLFRGLGRSVRMARLQNDLLAVETGSMRAGVDSEALECLKSQYFQLGAVVFLAPRMDPSTPNLMTLATEVFQDHELVTALNAATVSALSDWIPDTQYIFYRQPPRAFVDKRKPPPPPVPPPVEDADRYERPHVLQVRPSAAEPRETIVLEAVGGAAEAVVDGLLKEEPPPQPLVAQKPAEYERILGAFIADADVFVWLDPRLAAEAIDAAAARIAQRMLLAAARHFRNRGAPRPRAIALLNAGALEWSGGRPISAYQRVMEAQKIFAELGDIEGLAHAYEWLGYIFQESGDAQLASEHLRLGHALYRRLEDTTSVERILSYGSAD